VFALFAVPAFLSSRRQPLPAWVARLTAAAGLISVFVVLFAAEMAGMCGGL
jgi:hypothetical protein